MGACCQSCSEDTASLTPRYRRVLTVVLAINAIMFAVEVVWSLIAGSTALQADALDFLADTLTYGLTLSVLGRPLAVRARAALVKGGSLGVMAALVLGAALWRVFT
ncbi:MAG: cation transporter, partial [Rhodospirillaceae bacterium]